jgi:hypothetical protein
VGTVGTWGAAKLEVAGFCAGEDDAPGVGNGAVGARCDVGTVGSGGPDVAGGFTAPRAAGATLPVDGLAGIVGDADAAGRAEAVGGRIDAGTAGSAGAGCIRAVEGDGDDPAPGVTRVGTGSGGVERSVAASRCEAEAALSPVTGGARRAAGADPTDEAGGLAGAMAAGFAGTAVSATGPWVGIGGRPGSGGSEVILAVGTSPAAGAFAIDAGRGGIEGGAGTELVPGRATTSPLAGFAGSGPVEGFAGITEDPVKSEPVGGAEVALGAAAAAGVAESDCCGVRVSGITTGPVRRGGASGAGVSRSEAVCGRELRTGPAAGGVTRPVAVGLPARSGGRGSGTIAEVRRDGSVVSVRRIEPVGGRNAPVVDGLAGASGPVRAGGCWVRLSGMKTGVDFRATAGTDKAADAGESAGRVRPAEAGLGADTETGAPKAGGVGAGRVVPVMAPDVFPTAGNGAVGGRVETASACELAVAGKPPDAGRATDGRGRVGGRAGAGAVVRRRCAVAGRVYPPGSFGAVRACDERMGGACDFSPGSGAGGANGGAAVAGLTVPEAVGSPSVSRMDPVRRRGGAPARPTVPVPGLGRAPDRGRRVTRGTTDPLAVVGAVSPGVPGRAGGVDGASSGIPGRLGEA